VFESIEESRPLRRGTYSFYICEGGKMKKNNKKQSGKEINYLAVGIALGAGIGAAIGFGFGISLGRIFINAGFWSALGAGVGIAVGASIGGAIQKQKKK